VSVPEYTVAPSLLARTNLVFTTGRPFADHLASSMPLVLLRAPPELGRMKFDKFTPPARVRPCLPDDPAA
jgi:hypothetical protein